MTEKLAENIKKIHSYPHAEKDGFFTFKILYTWSYLERNTFNQFAEFKSQLMIQLKDSKIFLELISIARN